MTERSIKKRKLTRLFTMLDMLSVDPSQPAEVVIEKVEKLIAEIGLKSEKRAQEILSRLKNVERVDFATEDQDRIDKYDLIVTFKKHLVIDPMPVQIKTTNQAAEHTKYYENRQNRRIIVLAAGETVSETAIISSFYSQLRSLTKKLTK